MAARPRARPAARTETAATVPAHRLGRVGLARGPAVGRVPVDREARGDRAGMGGRGATAGMADAMEATGTELGRSAAPR